MRLAKQESLYADILHMRAQIEMFFQQHDVPLHIIGDKLTPRFTSDLVDESGASSIDFEFRSQKNNEKLTVYTFRNGSFKFSIDGRMSQVMPRSMIENKSFLKDLEQLFSVEYIDHELWRKKVSMIMATYEIK